MHRSNKSSAFFLTFCLWMFFSDQNQNQGPTRSHQWLFWWFRQQNRADQTQHGGSDPRFLSALWFQNRRPVWSSLDLVLGELKQGVVVLLAAGSGRPLINLNWFWFRTRTKDPTAFLPLDSELSGLLFPEAGRAENIQNLFWTDQQTGQEVRPASPD